MDEMTMKDRLREIAHNTIDQIRKEPILLWAVIFAIWTWAYPEASVAAQGVLIALGALFQRALSVPSSSVEALEGQAYMSGRLQKEQDIHTFLASSQAPTVAGETSVDETASS